MIKVENIETWGFEHAIRGMRNSYDSWSQSDSRYMATGKRYDCIDYVVGKNDLDLMHRLFKAGTSHRKYLRQIFVSMDILAPLYWWKEFDTYKIGVTANSCSTMHTLHKRELTIDDFSHEHLRSAGDTALQNIIDAINIERSAYIGDVDGFEKGDKQCWYSMIQMLPSSYNQKRTVTMSYENVVAILSQRKGHKLDEWQDFIRCLKCLSYIEDIIDG